MMDANKLEAAARAADMAAQAETPQEELRAVMEVLAHKEAIQIGMMSAQMARLPGASREERLPLREGGDDIGRVESRIPKKLFFHLMQQKNFGWEGLTSDEGQRDLRKTHPACFPKTVSGKIMTGYRKARVNFGRGTLNLAT